MDMDVDIDMDNDINIEIDMNMAMDMDTDTPTAIEFYARTISDDSSHLHLKEILFLSAMIS
jgi:hypothetical protein